ncbi:MAG: DEAD/DEAH box helicase family protein [Flavobacteriales bacterium]|nr:DEAD/DEAH box helicase family protein [Flavobacteriales bacterium]
MRVSDWSGTPQRGNPREEYSPGSLAGVNSKRDPAALEPGHAQSNAPLNATDRNDLDGQLFQQFSSAKDLLRQTPVQADSRDELRAMLTERQSSGIIFTTVQKFGLVKGETSHPVLCERTNVVVISDEAHRSQYGSKGRLNEKTGEYVFGCPASHPTPRAQVPVAVTAPH